MIDQSTPPEFKREKPPTDFLKFTPQILAYEQLPATDLQPKPGVAARLSRFLLVRPRCMIDEMLKGGRRYPQTTSAEVVSKEIENLLDTSNNVFSGCYKVRITPSWFVTLLSGEKQ